MSDPRESFIKRAVLANCKIKPYHGFVLLCGGPVDGKNLVPTSLRDVIYREILRTEVLVGRVRLVEDITDWAKHAVYDDLISFEGHLAEMASLIVLIVESPGAIAELGVFTIEERFREKLLVYVDAAHYEMQSFIRLGLLDFLEYADPQSVLPYSWLSRNPGRLTFNCKAAEALQSEIIETINFRASNALAERPFSESKWLHIALLICDLVSIMVGLQITEIQNYLATLGCVIELKELRRYLFVLENIGLITKFDRGHEKKLYVSIDSREFITFRSDDEVIAVDRVRADVLQFYESSSKKRFLAIKEVRRPK